MGMISIRRMEFYMQLSELVDYVENIPPPSSDDPESKEEGSISIVDGKFSWLDSNQYTPPPMKKKRGSRSPSVKKTVVDEASDVKDTKLTLVDINCLIKKGELVAVVGKVGSGKSSFLSSILGEIEPCGNSKVYIPREGNDNGFLSYCVQS